MQVLQAVYVGIVEVLERLATGKAGGKRFALGRIDPASKPFAGRNKARDKARVACLPSVVFTISANSSFLIMSTMCGRPSRTLFAWRQGTPAASMTLAVPVVATTSKPRSTRRRARTAAPGLSRSRTLISAEPLRGSTTLAAGLASCEALEHIDDSDVNRLQDLHQEFSA